MAKTKKIKQFTIDFKTWGEEFMRDSAGSMCCLGFLGKACGYKNDDLLGEGMPSTVQNRANKRLFPAGIISSSGVDDSYFSQEVASINDASEGAALPAGTNVSSPKIVLITRRFKDQMGITVKWKNVPKTVQTEVAKLKFSTTEKLLTFICEP